MFYFLLLLILYQSTFLGEGVYCHHTDGQSVVNLSVSSPKMLKCLASVLNKAVANINSLYDLTFSYFKVCCNFLLFLSYCYWQDGFLLVNLSRSGVISMFIDNKAYMLTIAFNVCIQTNYMFLLQAECECRFVS